MNSLLIICDSLYIPEIAGKFESHANAHVLRLDLAWELFLGKAGKNEAGEIDIPSGNPRTKWFPLQQWMRQTLGFLVDIMGQEQRKVLALLPPCSPAALEYVTRTLSIYSASLSTLHASSPDEVVEVTDAFFSASSHPALTNNWVPPILSMNNNPTALMQKTSKQQNGNLFTWLGSFLGSDRLFAQFYELRPGTDANRLHNHSDVDEMFVVLEGHGELETEQGKFSLLQGNIVYKPAGSGLSTCFIAGENGMKILDIEVWTRSDQTDIVVYPEHRETFLRGRGLNHVTAIENYFSGNEMMKHYAEKYERGKNGEIMPVRK
jgi:uncharacterized cupin superfamily protein